MKKAIAISLMFFGIVILAGCGQQSVSRPQSVTPAPVTQSNDETASWQKYENAELGFELKYPVSGYEAQMRGDDKTDPLFFIKNVNKDKCATMYQGKCKAIAYAFSLVNYQSEYSFPLASDPNGIFTTDISKWLDVQKRNGNNWIKTTVAEKLAYTMEKHLSGGELGDVDLKDYVIFLQNSKGSYDMYDFEMKKDDVGEKIISTLKFTK